MPLQLRCTNSSKTIANEMAVHFSSV